MDIYGIYNSLEEYCKRIESYWEQLNQELIVFHWRYEN
jgi:hypothetical protein